MIAGALLLLAAQAAGPAAAEVSKESRFAAEAVRICIDTGAEPAAVRQLAEGEKWASLDPAAVLVKTSMVLGAKKKKDRRTFTRTHAWTLEKEGLAMTVGLFDIPEQPTLKQCELIAWELDFDAVDKAFKADGRFTGGFDQGLPIRNYSVAGADMRVSYLKSDMGTRIIHVVSANRVK